ncbi:MAG: NUDIX domain-containing protein [Paracoccaceae bacterium]
MDFVGAKAALICAGAILCHLRDDRPGLRYPAWWDLPGGGREGDESPHDCLLRELDEEFGLRLAPERLTWARAFPSMIDHRRTAWFFGGALDPAEVAAIRLGAEGQGWRMMPLAEFLHHERVIPAMRARTLACLAA